jgi:tripartite-type tricarboxylate transporter receptor subunit TctC
MQKTLAALVVVENRAGAAGSIGAVAVAKPVPDGYTLLLGSSGTITAGPAVWIASAGSGLYRTIGRAVNEDQVRTC